jgi:hypothetical protein
LNMEDERFNTQKQQFEENKRFQQDQLDKAIAFFDASKKLQEESTAMQRAYWIEQQKLQASSLGVQAKAAADALSQKLTFDQLKEAADKAEGSLKTMTETDLQNIYDTIVNYTNPALEAFVTHIQAVGAASGGGNPPPGGGGGGGSETWTCPGIASGPKAHAPITFSSLAAYGRHMEDVHGTSGAVAAGFSQWVFNTTEFRAGEGALPEKVTVQPLGQGTYTNDSYRSRWNDTVSTPRMGVASQPSPIHLVIQMGDDILIDKVLNAVNQEVRL